ncbi:MAG: 16S rRNA (uracil(1498)-N(3))-methyltransferase [Pseudomonadales bacterium]|nr:16S rRNA (uracil(1498)-N(3))-methyltransferase [Pseudomonadales bacterium]MCP5183407.1 16S rRNA (uracil(1498)-N(3))-methyltransferase [Pseudomonadales bacterium]
MRRQRLYVPDISPAPGDIVTLPREQAHHLTRVLRAREGDAIAVFNGLGDEWEGNVTNPGKRGCDVTITRTTSGVEPPQPIHLAMALLKGDALDRAVQKSVELGAQIITLLHTDHCAVRWQDERGERRLEHLRRIIVAACEQSGARFLPQLRESVPLSDFLREGPIAEGAPRIALHPGGEPLPQALPYGPITLFVGPEGGWSPAETERFHRENITLHGLGGLILRAETAPLAAIAAVRQSWGWRL